jgi:hypothetical protein
VIGERFALGCDSETETALIDGDDAAGKVNADEVP